MSYFLGVDVGSFTTKGVLIEDGKVFDSLIIKSGINYEKAAFSVYEELLSKNGLKPKDISYAVATGYGAKAAPFASSHVTDIVCSARGINHIFPSVRTLIDIGSQHTQIIWLDDKGMVTNFVANEKCAAGSGRFLQVIANVLRIDLSLMGSLSLNSKNPVTFTTGCAVFGESEAITRVCEGIPKEDIIAGVHNSLAEKIKALVGGHGLKLDCAICGGAALDIGLIKSIEEKFQIKLLVPENPQTVAALGAAITASRLFERKKI